MHPTNSDAAGPHRKGDFAKYSQSTCELVEAAWEVLSVTPHTLSPTCELDLVLCVCELLDGASEGRLLTEQVYDALQDEHEAEIKGRPGRFKKLPDKPDNVVTVYEQFKAPLWRVGERALRLYQLHGGESKQSLVAAAKYLVDTGDITGATEKLHNPTREPEPQEQTPADPPTDQHPRRHQGGRRAIETGSVKGPDHDNRRSERSDRGCVKGRSEHHRQFAPAHGSKRRLLLEHGRPLCPYIDVPETLFDAVREWAPALDEYEALAALAQWQLFGTYRDDHVRAEQDLAGIVIPKDLLARFAGYESAQAMYDRGLNTTMLLDAYKEFVDPQMEWTDWHGALGRARVIKRHGMPEAVVDAVKRVMLAPEDHGTWCYFIDGRSAGRREWTLQLERERAEALEEMDRVTVATCMSVAFEGPPAASLAIREYLNTAPQQDFGRTDRGYLKPDAIERAKACIRSTIDDERRRDDELRKLYWMRKYPKPLYAFCERSPRLKADHHNQLMNLRRQDRRALYTKRDVELDLSKAHLAAYVPVAKREGIDMPVLSRYLSSSMAGEIDLWGDIAEQVTEDGFGDSKALRQAVKRTYAVGYGCKRLTALHELYQEYGRLTGDYPPEGFGPLRAILEHAIFVELFDVRDQLREIIQDRGGLEDAFGRHVPITLWGAPEGGKEDTRWRGVLSYINSSFEVALIYEAFKLAFKEREKDRPLWKIWLYQCDGFTLRYSSRASAGTVIQRIRDAVKLKAAELGMPTALEVAWRHPVIA